jgi:hypothetical protein
VADDQATAALKALIAALEQSDAQARPAIERAHQMERLLEQGYSWRQVLATEDRPLLTDILYRNMALMNEVVGRLRREEARSLHDEGAKRDEIADLFGLSAAHLDAMLEGHEA